MALRTRPAEWLLASYAAVAALVGLARAPDNPLALSVAAGHLLIVALVVLLRRRELGPAGRTIRELAPIALLVALYASLDVLNGFGTRPTFDPAIQRWEAALFGGQPSRDWWRARPSALWSTILHGAYFAYYAIVPFPLLLFLRRRDPGRARAAAFTILAAFMLCYLWFLFLPVAGPYYEFERPDASLLDNPAARLVYGVLAGGSSFGAAFPSSHVAGTWAAVAATAAGAPGWALALSLPAGLLTVGVVYTQMHYAVDALGGLAVAAVAIGAAALLRAGRTAPGS